MPSLDKVNEWKASSTENKEFNQMISVIIPVFNKSDLTERCLASLLQNSKITTQVIVINNASTDKTSALLNIYSEKFKNRKIDFLILENETNLGFGRACNLGIRLANGKFIAVLNNDTWVMPNWDEVLVQVSEKHNLDLVGPFFDERPGSTDLKERCEIYLKSNREKLRRHFVPILLFFKKSALEKLKLSHGGIFDERFFITYEDTDLLFRIRELGLTYAQTSLCYIWHQSMGTRSAPGLLTKNYEEEGLRLFQEKWNLDPRAREHTLLEKLKRKYRKYRSAKGLF